MNDSNSQPPPGPRDVADPPATGGSGVNPPADGEPNAAATSASRPPAVSAEAVSAEEVRAQLDATKSEILKEIEKLTLVQPLQQQPLTPLQAFLASNTFFVALGLLLLALAYIGLTIGVHTSFSFVLVVLGVAILLFGTGTQGVGKLQSDTTTAKYNVAIAGGAGLLALAIGYGMAAYGPEMQRAFGVETRYVMVMLQPNRDGSSTFANYWAEFDVDGIPIASVRRGDVLLAFVPYLDTQKNIVKRVAFRLRPHDPRVLSANFKPIVEDRFEVPIAAIDRFNAGADFPTYDKIPPVDMRSTTNANVVLRAAADRTLPLANGAAVPNPTAPATLEVQ